MKFNIADLDSIMLEKEMAEVREYKVGKSAGMA